MDVTLLGSGDAVGMPAPLCDCRYCRDGPTRRRPGLVIETDATTVVLDASPDLKSQLHETGVTDIDAFFLTHHHFDHVGGLHELGHAAMGFDAHVGIESGHLPADTFTEAERPSGPEFCVYLTETARGHLEGANPHLVETLDLVTLDHESVIDVGDLSVEPVPVEHARSQFDTLGFVVTYEDGTVVYAPDMWEFADQPAVESPSLCFAEGAALFRAFGHGDADDLREALAAVDAQRTVLLNLNEHLQRMTTDEMQAIADSKGYELGRDFATYRLPPDHNG